MEVGDGKEEFFINSWSHPKLHMHGSDPKQYTGILRTELLDRAQLNSQIGHWVANKETNPNNTEKALKTELT